MLKKTLLIVLLSGIIISLPLPAYCKKKQQTNQPTNTTNVDHTELFSLDWWENFRDPVLIRLLKESLEKNQDIKVADLKELEMKEWVKASFGRELPSVSIGPEFYRNLNSYNAYPEPAGQFFGGSWNTFKLPINASYELDLWRQNRQITKAQAKLHEASIQDRRTAYLSITTAVATVYLNIAKADKLITLQKELIALNEERHKILKAKYDAGMSSANDVIKADQTIIDAKNNLISLEKLRETLMNELATLTGNSPLNSPVNELTSIDKLQLFYIVPDQVDSDKIMNRPDILKAEALLEQSRINVSVARKEFLPKLKLSGFIGYSSIKLSNFFNWDSFITGVATSMLEVLFDGGQRRANLKANKYKYEQMIQSYQKTFINGLQELNDSYVTLKRDLQTNDEYVKKIALENQNLELLKLRYKSGLLSRLVLIENQQSVLLYQQEQVSQKTSCLIDTISVYKAVGGKL